MKENKRTKAMEEVIKELSEEATVFVRHFVRERFDFLLSARLTIEEIDNPSVIADIEFKMPVVNFGRNIVLPEFLEKMQVMFTLVMSEKEIYITRFCIDFQHKGGGHNAWEHGSKFVKADNGFIEIPS